MPPLSAERRKLSAMQQEKRTVSQESHVFTRRQLASMTLPFILDSLSIMLISMLITALISSGHLRHFRQRHRELPAGRYYSCRSGCGQPGCNDRWAIHRPGCLPGCPALRLWLHCPGSWAAVLCFSLGLDIEGLWIAMWAEWAVRTVALSIRLLRGSWWKGEKKEISVKENTL